MKALINKVEFETLRWGSLASGSLFTVPKINSSPVYIKSKGKHSVCLLTGDLADQFLNEDQVIDVTDKYVIVDTCITNNK
jgi:hypothetical protein